jgi:hypothetical protein
MNIATREKSSATNYDEIVRRQHIPYINNIISSPFLLLFPIFAAQKQPYSYFIFRIGA